MLCQMTCLKSTVHRDSSEGERPLRYEQAGGRLLVNVTGRVRVHAIDVHPKETTAREVAQVQGGITTAPPCQGCGGKRAATLPANEWLHMICALCAQQLPNMAALLQAICALGDVPTGELQLESRLEETLDGVKALLGCGGHDNRRFAQGEPATR
jgi:hypothetical protein